jgi:hypothetical protein
MAFLHRSIRSLPDDRLPGAARKRHRAAFLLSQISNLPASWINHKAQDVTLFFPTFRFSLDSYSPSHQKN